MEDLEEGRIGASLCKIEVIFVVDTDSALRQHIERLTLVNSILMTDLSLSLELLKQRQAATGPSDIWQLFFLLKSVVRAFFAEVDFVSYSMRTAVLASDIALSNKDRAALSGLHYDPTTDRIKKKKKRIGTEESLELALTHFPKICLSAFLFDADAAGWRCFHTLNEERNAFTHPTQIEDLFPSRSAECIVPAINWFAIISQHLLLDSSSILGAPPTAKAEFPEFSYPKFSLLSPTMTFDASFYDEVKSNPLARLRYAQAMLGIMGDETMAAFALLSPISSLAFLAPEGQFRFRNLLRTLFSNAEGMVRVAKNYLAWAQGKSADSIGSLGKTGKTGEKLAQTLTKFSAAHGCNYKIRVQGDDWEHSRLHSTTETG